MAKSPGGFSVGRVSIQVVPDTSNFRKELKAQLEKASKGLKVEIPVNVNAKKAVTQLKVLDRAVKRLNGRTINIGAKVNQKGDLDSLSKGIKKLGSSAGDASEGFSKMSRMGMILVAVVLLLAPALAVIATLLAGLPSLLFAFGAAAFAVGLGMEGLKKAASGFTPTIDRLKASLSKTFADQLTKPFIELNKIAPVLDAGLNKIAVSLSNIIKDMIGFATSAKGMEQLNTILQNTAKFFEFLRPAILDGVRAFTLLGATASTEFENLASTFNTFSKRFLDIVETATDTGVLTSALRNLNIVLFEVLDAFNKFFDAGLKAMTELGGPLASFIDGFSDAIVALMPFLTELSGLVLDVLGEAFKQLVPIFDALTPGLKALGDLLGPVLVEVLRAVGPLLTRVAEIFTQVLLKAIEAISPFIQPLLDFFTQLAGILGEALLVAFITLSPFLDQFFGFIQDILTALTPLLPKILELAMVVLKAFLDALVRLAPLLTDFAQDLFPQLVQIVTDLVPIFERVLDILIDIIPIIIDFASAFLEWAIPAMTEMAKSVGEIWPSIEQIISGSLEFIQGIINLVFGLITLDTERMWEGVKQIFSGAWEGIKGTVKGGIATVLELFIALPGRLLSALSGVPSQFAASGRAMMQGLIDGIVAMGKSAVNAALNIAKQIRDLLPFSPAKTGPFSGKGYTLYSGMALMEDWAKGIEEGGPTAIKAMEDVVGMAQTAMDIEAAVTAEGFGGIGAQVANAIKGMEIKADGQNIARVVNKNNNLNARR